MSEINLDRMNPRTIAEGFTQSEITLYDRCAYKWNLRYNNGIYSPGKFEVYNLFGHGFHRFCADFYRGVQEIDTPVIEIPEDIAITTQIEDERDYWQAILEAACQAYLHYYKSDHKFYEVQDGDCIERHTEYTIKLRGHKIRLRGVIDMIALHERKPAISDHKALSMINSATVHGWDFKFQFMFYIWLARKALDYKAVRFIANGFQKPTLRLKKDENHEQFVHRVAQTVLTEPSRFFYRETMHLEKGSLEHFEQTVLMPKLHRIARMMDSNLDADLTEILFHDKNTETCHAYNKTCEYLGICKYGIDNELPNYAVHEHKHQEIEHPA